MLVASSGGKLLPTDSSLMTSSLKGQNQGPEPQASVGSHDHAASRVLPHTSPCAAPGKTTRRAAVLSRMLRHREKLKPGSATRGFPSHHASVVRYTPNPEMVKRRL